MARSTFTRRLFALHSWLGLGTGLLLLVISLSGVALVFEPELDHALNPTLLRVPAPPVGGKASLDNVMAAARQRFPQPAYLRLRRLPEEPTQAVEVSVDQPDHRWTLAYFDPYTARYLGQRDARAHVFGWLLGVHYSLWGGKSGELVAGVLGVLLVLSVLTGVVVYRKHLLPVLLFRPKLNWKNWRTAASGLHRVIGVWSLVFNLLMAGSGVWMLRAVFWPETYQPETVKALLAQPIVPVSLDSLAATAARALPGFQLQGLALPKTAADTVVSAYGKLPNATLLGNFSQTIELHARTGHVLKADDIRRASVGEKLELTAFTLHFGQFGGVLVKVLWAVLGLSPALLSLTGFMLWWRRKRVRTQAKPQLHQRVMQTS
ncbi:PepSY-associated TM helix domain-containing protein [Hymenobacter koreensis]|uniref:PepSY-associated TM helix domain-containing protein n=1 Tax=Hymenobacter koreensis TaxID=1084523 RepID=A0ABP8JI22_9BACT